MHTKKALERLSRRRLALTLFWLLSMLKTKSPELYAKAEKKAGLDVRKQARNLPGKRQKHAGKRKHTRKQNRLRAAKAMRYRVRHHVSLKEAWKHV